MRRVLAADGMPGRIIPQAEGPVERPALLLFRVIRGSNSYPRIPRLELVTDSEPHGPRIENRQHFLVVAELLTRRSGLRERPEDDRRSQVEQVEHVDHAHDPSEVPRKRDRLVEPEIHDVNVRRAVGVHGLDPNRLVAEVRQARSSPRGHSCGRSAACTIR